MSSSGASIRGASQSKLNAQSSSNSVKQTSNSGNPMSAPSNSSRTGDPTKKKEIPPPTGFGSFFLMLILYWCKRLMIVRPDIKLGIYLCTVAILSVVFDFFSPPMTFLGRRNSFLNIVFAKWGWAWTCIPLFVFSVITNYVMSCGDKQIIRSHIIRLFHATIWWYVATGVFNTIQRATERCSTPSYEDKQSCLRAGARWAGFDISGHCFLMIVNALTIVEEVRTFANWDRVGQAIREEQNTGVRRIDVDSLRRTAYVYEQYTPVLRFLFVLLTALTLIWELQLLATVVYFHDLPSKMFGSLTAAAYWFIMYRCVYVKRKASTGGITLRCPMPGYGVVFGGWRDETS